MSLEPDVSLSIINRVFDPIASCCDVDSSLTVCVIIIRVLSQLVESRLHVRDHVHALTMCWIESFLRRDIADGCDRRDHTPSTIDKCLKSVGITLLLLNGTVLKIVSELSGIRVLSIGSVASQLLFNVNTSVILDCVSFGVLSDTIVAASLVVHHLGR